MNQEEAIHVLETIKDIYPTYAISKIKAKMLIPELLPMDYSLVMEKLAKHVKDHPYAPTISEIAAYPKKQNEQLDSLKKWREQAKKVPPEFRKTFHHQMLQLIREKGYDNDC